MATRKPLVQIAGVLNELPASDDIDIGASAMPSNVVSSTTTVPADRSLVIVSYLDVQGTLTVNGNLMIIG